MGLLNFKQLTEEECALLFKPHRNTPIRLTPQEKLDAILRKLGSRNISVRRYHFKLVEGDNMLHLYTGTKEFLSEFEKTSDGIRDAREFSREMFLKVKKELRQGGYKFDLVVDNRQIDLTLGYDMNEEKQPTINHEFASNAEFKRAKMGLINHIETKFAAEDLETKIAAINSLTNLSESIRQAAIDYFM